MPSRVLVYAATTLEPPAGLLGRAEGCHSELTAASSSTGLSRAPATRPMLISCNVTSCSPCLLLKPSNQGVYSHCFSAPFSTSQHRGSNSTALSHAWHGQGSLNATSFCHPSHHNYPFAGSVMLLGLRGSCSLRPCDALGTPRMAPSTSTPKQHPLAMTGLGNGDDPLGWIQEPG